MTKLKEITKRSVNKSLNFEKSGETLSVEISIENVSPESKAEAIEPFLDTLFDKAKKKILECNDASI